MAIVKERTGRHDEELANIPELIKVEFRPANSRTTRLAQDVADLKSDTEQQFNKVGQRFDRLEKKVDALIEGLPRNVGDVVREVLNERNRRGN